MLVDAYASAPHYAAHLAPIWDALPVEARGTFWRPPDARYQWGDMPFLGKRDIGRLMIVASWRDAHTMSANPLVYVEHGAGQTYYGDPVSAGNGSYAGGAGLEKVRLFICPNDTVAEQWNSTYPDTPTAVVGCPRLDRWHAQPRPQPVGKPTVAVTFHWELSLVPETRSAWRYYDPVLPQLSLDDRFDLLGHGHPRLWGTIKRRWQQLGIEHTPDFDEVLERADLLVMDNTSAGYEAASVGIPVLVLNAPWYRRDVHHGLRFWDLPPGIQCDTTDQLADTIMRGLEDPPEARAMRAAAVAAVYDRTDGHAARRAAEAIMEHR